MATAAQWIQGARLRTLPAAIAPVLIGSAAAYEMDSFLLFNAILAALVALLLQVGVNFANDYSDGIRGTDEERVGPVRLVGQGLAEPGSVKFAAFAAFFFAGLCGLALVALSGLWIMIPIGAAAIVAAWYYTGGSRPYGYLGLGEVFVFVFFGLVAVVGTAFVQTGSVDGLAVAASVPIGLLSVALLVVNNLRDIEGDAAVGKRTLAVLLGDRGTRIGFAALPAVAFAVIAAIGATRPPALLALLAVPLAVPPVRTVLTGARGPALIAALQATALLTLATGVLLGAGLALSG